MTDEELIARLRKADEYEPLGHDGWEAADRIEALVKERDSLLAGHRALNIGGARLQDRAEAAEARIKQLEAAVLAAAKIGQIVGFLGEDEGRIEAFREACGPELWAKARAALKGGEP